MIATLLLGRLKFDAVLLRSERLRVPQQPSLSPGYTEMRTVLFILMAFCVPYVRARGTRNAYQLPTTRYYRDGYDWWWHNLIAKHHETGELRPFFMQYYVMNPGLGGPEPVLPSREGPPSYSRLSAGTWGSGAVQIHNYFGVGSFKASQDVMDVAISGVNTANETHLRGSVSVTPEEAAARPEWMSDAGLISWDLKVDKQLQYSAGIATSDAITRLLAFEMLWHVQGMKAQYSGTITFNGQLYDVIPEQSYGYQDKNWGKDFTSPWIWISCNKLTSKKFGGPLPLTSLDVGGGQPRVHGISLGEKVIVAFNYEGKLYSWNFAKLGRKPPIQTINITETADDIHWYITSEDDTHQIIKPHKIVLHFGSAKQGMLNMKYYNPKGAVVHKDLWNGAHLTGTVDLYKWGRSREWELVDSFTGELGAGEYGYAKPDHPSATV
jgi:hypothetical protein